MNSVQSPQILSDLYRDLRDRRLLPLVVVLVAGMAIVPIALSSSPESSPVPAPPAAVVAKANAPDATVVVSNPGLRDYKRRLAGDAPKDPFVQQFPLPVSSGAADSSSSGSSSAAGVADTGTSGASGTTPPTSGGSTGGSTTTQQPQTQSKFFFYRVKVRAGKLGEGLKTHDSVGSLTPLPSKKVPAATFLGVNTDGSFQAKTAVFLISSAVSSVDGEGSCSFAGSACQLLTLKPGQHEDLVWVDGSVYRIELVKFSLIARNDPPSTGKQKKSGRDSGSEAPAGRHFSF